MQTIQRERERLPAGFWGKNRFPFWSDSYRVSNKNRRAFCFFFVFRLATALLIVPFSGLFRCGSEETLVRLCLLDSLIGEIHSGFLILVEDVAEYFLGGTSDSVGNIFSSSVLILSIHK